MASKIDKPIKNYLIDFGLTDKEVTVYLTLLKTGPNTIMNLARETGIKRSTTHNTVEELIKKGLVSQTNYGERRMLVAEDPKKLEFLMEQKRWDMRKLEDNLPDIVKSIYDTVPQARENSEVGVKYYEGQNGVKSIYIEALKSKELRSYVNMEEVLKALPDNGELFLDAQIKNSELILKEIVQDSEIAREHTSQFSKNKRYMYKFSPKSLSISALDILMFDGKVAIVSLGHDTKVSGMVLSSQYYYENMKHLFDFVWDIIN